MEKNYLLLFFLLFASLLIGQKPIHELCSSGKIRHAQVDWSKMRQTDNQYNYDVHYYGLDLQLDPGSETINGKVEIALTVIDDSISYVELDLNNSLQIFSVESKNQNLTFTHDNDLAQINLEKHYLNGENILLEVNYGGSPSSDAFNFDVRQGEPLIWSLSEPYGARDWWPCKDYPFDKADSASIQIHVPEGLVAGSNGELIEEVTENGWTRFLWKENYPITTYLISVAAHPYRIERDYFHYGSSDSMEVVHYIFPDHFDNVVEDYQKTTEMLEFYSATFGEYPFIEEKYGHAEFPWGGGMEHQTLSSMLGPYEYLIAHELAHQWWGNMITCKDFHHIWLNEGFATYAEALWAEYKYGKEAYFDNINENTYLGDGMIYVDDLSNDARIFSGNLSYKKASWVLHMLRHVLGDEVFFQVLMDYGNSSRKYGVATTEDFKKICEERSGKELDEFFDQWIYDENHPVYAYEWSYTPSGNEYEVVLTISQEQAFPVFSMPIDVIISYEGGDTLLVIENDLSVQDYGFTIPYEPNLLEVDPEGWILKETITERKLVHHSNNHMSISLADNGAIGFDRANGNGNGLIYPENGENLLYFGTVMVGTSSEKLLDVDLGSGEPAFERKAGSILDFEEEGNFQRANLSYHNKEGLPLDLEIIQNSVSSDQAEIEDVLFLKYQVKNTGDTTLNDLYFGVFLDLDIGYYLDNELGNNLEEQLIFQENGIFSGIKSLDKDEVRLIAVRNAVDNFRDTIKWQYLKGQRNDFLLDEKADWAVLLSYGPYSMGSNETIERNVAIIAEKNLEDLILASKEAQSFFDFTNKIGQDLPKKASFRIYPNPVNDVLFVESNSRDSGNIEMILRNTKGEKVLHKKYDLLPNSFFRQKLDLSGMPAGAYVLTIVPDRNAIVTKEYYELIIKTK